MSVRLVPKRPLRSSFWLLIVLLEGFSFGRGASAQWQSLKTFPQQVRSVYFLDRIGSPATGFVGLIDGEIWRTSDNGATWTKCSTPQPNIIGIPVSSFIFKDQNLGWAGISANSGYNGVWQTTDGGVSWTRLNSITGNTVCVSYSAQTDRLFAISWTGQAKVSTDAGTTWTAFASVNQNGVWFEGARGVISNLKSQGFLFTTDGGMSWSPSTPALPTECWTPWAFPNSKVFVAVSEKTREFLVSNDGGQSWNVKHVFPTSTVPRGSVVGSGGSLLVQTNQGFFVSHDTGVTWFSICGPSNDLDTRFYAKGNEIFAGELGPTLWYDPNAGVASLAQFGFANDRYATSASRCSSSDSAMVFHLNPTCSTVLTSIELLRGGPQFQIAPGVLPRSLGGASDSIQIHYQPGAGSRDSGLVLLRFTVAGRTFDTTISLYGTATRGASLIDMPSALAVRIPSACSVVDTVLAIHNIGCDSVTLLSASVDDPTHFMLTAGALPKVLVPTQYSLMHVTCQSHVSGDFFADVRLHMRMGGREFDTIIAVSMKVLSALRPILPSLSLELANRCQEIDTEITILNPSCDSIRVTELHLLDTSVFQLSGLSFPFTLQSAGAVPIDVHASASGKGSFGTAVYFSYLDVENNRHDTTVPLHLEVKSALPAIASFSSSSIDLGAVNAPCSSVTRELKIWNTQCGLAKVVAVKWEQPMPDFSVSTPKLPVVLGSEDTTQVAVTFAPTALGKRSERLMVTLDVDGAQRDTAIAFSGIGTSTFEARMPSRPIGYDSVRICETVRRTVPVINASCDEIRITSADVMGSTGFSVVDTRLPLSIPSGDTGTIAVLFEPITFGQVEDSLRVNIREGDDPTEHSKAIALSAFVKARVHLATLNAIDLHCSAADPCQRMDTSIVLRNVSPCDELVVEAMDVSGMPGVTIDRPSLMPIHIQPGDSIVLPIQIEQISDTLQTATIRLRGSWLDTVVTIEVNSTASGRHLLLAEGDSVLSTYPCVPTRLTRKVYNDGCKPIVMDSIAVIGLTGQTQLTASVSRAMPFVLDPNDSVTIELQFDPDGEGDGTAELRIASEQASFKRTLDVRGEIRGTVPVMRLGAESTAIDQPVTAQVGQTFGFSIVSLDAVSDTVPLNSLQASVRFNPDLLVCRKVIPAVGWTVLSLADASTGVLKLTLQRQPGKIESGDGIAQVLFEPRLTDSVATDIALSDVRLNGGDPTFERCVLSSIVSSKTVRFVVSDTCGTRLLRDKIRGVPELDLIGVSPNPARRGDAVELTVYSAATNRLSVRLVSPTAEVLKSIAVDVTGGLNTIELPTSGVPSGPHVVVVSSDLEVRSRKLVIQ